MPKKTPQIGIPYYLQSRLNHFGINTIEELFKYDYRLVYQWIKDIYPSVSNKVLLDLYSIYNNLPLNNLDIDTKSMIKKELKEYPPHYAPLTQNTINKYLNQAVETSLKTTTEIPVGALIVKDDLVIASGYNQTIKGNNILLHAEIVAINEASKKLANYRLDGCDLYVTIEPCLMCVGAIIHSRIKRVIYGAVEPKSGAITSQFQVLNNISVNKHTEAIGPIDNEIYSKTLVQFLKSKR